ncbi:uncharacterized protein ACWYII_007859 [Salvelinus alpinus]
MGTELSVLALPSPEQKAELVLHPGNGGLDNITISLLFQSLLGPLINNAHLNQSMYNATMMSNMIAGNATGPHELDRTLNDFLSFLRPLGSFIKTLVGSIQARNVSSERQHVLAQAVVNWILAELAGHISPNFTLTNEIIPSQTPFLSNFNITSLKDWFQHVVLPALNRFQLNNQTQIPHDLTAVFNQVFSLNPPMGSNSSMYSMVGPMDVCQIGNNDDMCSVSHAAENLSVILRCVPHSNLSLTGENLKLLVTELSKTLTGPHTMMNGSSGWPNLTYLFGQLPTDGFSAESLGDENFIRFWFLIRLRPLLPSVSEEYLSCLSTRDFSCQSYQALYVDVLPMLRPRQLGEVASTPGQLRNPGDVHMILIHVLPRDLGEFFDIVSPAVEGLHLPVDVRQVLLQQVFDNANLSDPSIKDPEVLVWLGQRLRPLLPNLTEEHVAPLFNIVRHRDCNTSQETVALLNSILPSLSNGTQAAVQHQIIMSLRESTPLRCYRNNSFFMFLRQSFLIFTFPKLTNFLSLIPPQRESELLNTMHPSELGTFLRKPEVVDNKTKLCTIFQNYKNTPEFLETENLPDDVKRPVLPCVWPLALATDDKAEVDRWFDNRLRNYLKFLNRNLLQSSDTLNASCLP